jgi:succinate dehydrogenase hydrophobic anchor subunit
MFASYPTLKKGKNDMPDFTLPALAGILLSLFFTYFPGASTWYEKLTAQAKSIWMLVFLLVACAVLFAAGCLGYSAQVACNLEGIKSLFAMFVAAAVANQSTYLLTKNI